MRRIFWTLLFVGVSIGWLVLSYRPEVLAGREIAFAPRLEPFSIWLFAGSALLFVLIQFVLVAAVRTFPTRIARSGDSQGNSVYNGDKEIRIHAGAEFFWTALPLLISLLLFWAVWQFWTGA